MRYSILRLLAFLPLAHFSVEAPPPKDTHPATVEEDVLGQRSAGEDTVAAVDGSTRFNNMVVPPMKELTGEHFEDETKEGYWFVPILLRYYFLVSLTKDLQVREALFAVLSPLPSDCSYMADTV